MPDPSACNAASDGHDIPVDPRAELTLLIQDLPEPTCQALLTFVQAWLNTTPTKICSLLLGAACWPVC
jgi:hypothetical protein